MIAETIEHPASRPTYRTLVSRGGRPSLMVADGAGAAALLALAKGDPMVMRHAHVIYLPRGHDAGMDLQALQPAGFTQAASYDAVLSRLRKLLAEATMTTQLYLAGTEALIGKVVAEALAVGLHPDAIQSEHRGSAARRMQCVHCKGMTEEVTTDPVVCSHCGLTLFVRDHFSRRLGAFQGVCVDAEAPGDIPPTQEIAPWQG
ncbi:dimethylamine monooxygenase subunit DmmA family protein [Paracoccus sp. Ld10]|uniref:dimethylamine monooxygenase subunit DmmA family protein n=1 Tax=Paracoccus sp. Ld10 TaxID=649158 RepID=UPI0038704AF6